MSVNKLRVLALVHRHLIPPAAVEEGTDITSAPWRTEYDVISTLTAMGHEVQALGVHDDLGEIRRLATEWKPHIAFNLLEGFDDITIFDQNVVSHLELLKLPYTGCNPRGLTLARDKALTKKVLAYHGIAVPLFQVFPLQNGYRPGRGPAATGARSRAKAPPPRRATRRRASPDPAPGAHAAPPRSGAVRRGPRWPDCCRPDRPVPDGPDQSCAAFPGARHIRPYETGDLRVGRWSSGIEAIAVSIGSVFCRYPNIDTCTQN